MNKQKNALDDILSLNKIQELAFQPQEIVSRQQGQDLMDELAPMPDTILQRQLPNPQPELNPINQYEQAIASAQRDQRNLALLQAANQVGAALAGGGRFTPQVDTNLSELRPLVGQELSGIKERDAIVETQGKRELARIKQSTEKDKMNPQSEASRIAREAYASSLRRIGRNRLADQVEEREMSLNELESIFGGLNLQNMETLFESAQSRKELAQIREQAKKDTKLEELNPFEKEEVKKLASAASEYTSKDRPQLITNLNKVDSAIELLNTKSGISGPGVGNIPQAIRYFTNPDSIRARDDVRSAIQDTLRPTLGAQFTEKEGERIMSFAFDERLPQEENVKRANRLREAITRKVEFQDAYYNHLRQGGRPKDFDFAKYGMQPVVEATTVQPTNKQAEFITLRAPNGEIARVRADQAKKYLDKGAVRVDE